MFGKIVDFKMFYEETMYVDNELEFSWIVFAIFLINYKLIRAIFNVVNYLVFSIINVYLNKNYYYFVLLNMYR